MRLATADQTQTSTPSAPTDAEAPTRTSQLRGLDLAAQDAALAPDGGIDVSGIDIRIIPGPTYRAAATGFGDCLPRVSMSVSEMNGRKPTASGSIQFEVGLADRKDRVDITSADSAAITAENWQQVQADLTPDTFGYAPRTQFYAKHLSKEHELVHYADYLQAARAKADARLATLAASSPGDMRAISAKVQSEVMAIEGDLIESYAGPGRRAAADCREAADIATYVQRPGEAHAFGAGKARYEALAAAIGARFATRGAEPKATRD